MLRRDDCLRSSCSSLCFWESWVVRKFSCSCRVKSKVSSVRMSILSLFMLFSVFLVFS